MRAVKKMKKIIGTIPRLYDRYLIADMCNVSNSYADAIDYLVECVSKQDKEIERLKSRISELENATVK